MNSVLVLINSLLMWWWHCAQQDATNIPILLLANTDCLCAVLLLFFWVRCVFVIDFKLRYSYNNQEIGSTFLWSCGVLYNTFLLLPEPKMREEKHFLGYTITIIMSIFRHVMHGISVSTQLNSLPLCACVCVCVRTILIIMRRQIGLRLKWFFSWLLLLFRKETHTKSWQRSTHINN